MIHFGQNNDDDAEGVRSRSIGALFARRARHHCVLTVKLQIIIIIIVVVVIVIIIIVVIVIITANITHHKVVGVAAAVQGQYEGRQSCEGGTATEPVQN